MMFYKIRETTGDLLPVIAGVAVGGIVYAALQYVSDKDPFTEGRAHTQALSTLEGRLHIEGNLAALTTESAGNYLVRLVQDGNYQHVADAISCDGKNTRITYRLNDEEPRVIDSKYISSIDCGQGNL